MGYDAGWHIPALSALASIAVQAYEERLASRRLRSRTRRSCTPGCSRPPDITGRKWLFLSYTAKK